RHQESVAAVLGWIAAAHADRGCLAAAALAWAAQGRARAHPKAAGIIPPQLKYSSVKPLGSSRLWRPRAFTSRSPHSAMVVSSSLRITSSALLTPASPIAP